MGPKNWKRPTHVLIKSLFLLRFGFTLVVVVVMASSFASEEEEEEEARTAKKTITTTACCGGGLLLLLRGGPTFNKKIFLCPRFGCVHD